MKNEHGIDYSLSASLNGYIAQKKLKDTIGYLVTFPNGDQEFLIAINNEPAYASTRLEDAAVFIDALKVKKDFGIK